jgi:hypothetical protein
MENSKTKIEDIEEVFEDSEDLGFSQPQSKYHRVYFVKMKIKDDPHFELSFIQNDKKYTQSGKQLEGKLINVKKSTYIYEEKEVKTLKLHLEYLNPKNEQLYLFILGVSYTSISRNLLNCLLNFNEPIEKLVLSLYSNKDGFAALYTMINSKKASWKYSMEEQKPMIEEVKNKKGEVTRYYYELNDFFEEKIMEHLDIILPNRSIEPEEGGDANVFLETPPEEPKEDIKEKKARIKKEKEQEIFGEDAEDFFDKIGDEIN